MAITIVGREKEKEKLDKILQSNQAEFFSTLWQKAGGQNLLDSSAFKKQYRF